MAALSEQSEQSSLVRHLSRCGICYAAVPNGGKRDKRTAGALASSGVQKGIPDLLIFDSPPNAPEKVGVAIEMKRVVGGRTSASQHRWLRSLQARGWVAFVAKGSADALRRLRELGFGV